LNEVWQTAAASAPPLAVRPAAPAPQPPPPAPIQPAPVRAAAPASASPAPASRATPIKLGRVVSVAGCMAQIELIDGAAPRAEIGCLAKILTQNAIVIGVISALKVEPAAIGEKVIVDLLLVGQLVLDGARLSFRRGVAQFPCIGNDAYLSDRQDLTLVYSQVQDATIEVGTLYQDPAVPARLLSNDLFSKHFAIVGTTGCGKSSALTVVLQQALAVHKYAHVLVLDIHGEYACAFGNQAEVISAASLHLPFWLLNFQELRHVLASLDDHYDSQVEILYDAILFAKKRYSEAASGRVRTPVYEPTAASVDAPTPFRLFDLIAFIDEQLGKLERPHPTIAYRRLKARIETLTTDPRYSFIFGNPKLEDNMVDVLAQLFRIPNDGRPLTIVELATVPEEILDVVILLIARLTFDLAVWSEGGLPVLLVCEEAHRYIPADDRKGFHPTRQALARIAKEGRKYGISLALVTQRPSELDPTILSQCSTILAMRLATEADQRVMRANVHDSTFGILEYLPLLADREAIVLGRGAPMPMRIRFQNLPASCLPTIGQEDFTQRWATPNMDRRQLEETVARWRGQGRR
jgi:DNA helicase HerA-like ATPase